MDEHEQHIEKNIAYDCTCLVCQSLQMGDYKPDAKRVGHSVYLSNSTTEAGRPITSIGHKVPHYRPLP